MARSSWTLTRRSKQRWRTLPRLRGDRDMLRGGQSVPGPPFPDPWPDWTRPVRWMRLRQSQARAILRNPAYAGAYVSGRTKSERQIDAGGNIRTRVVELPPEGWEVVIPDHHPGYISWDTYLANQRQFAANRPQRGARPVREGSALLQGIVLCGGCGRPWACLLQFGSIPLPVPLPPRRDPHPGLPLRQRRAGGPGGRRPGACGRDTRTDRPRRWPRPTSLTSVKPAPCGPSSCGRNGPAMTPPAPSVPITSANPKTGLSP